MSKFLYALSQYFCLILKSGLNRAPFTHALFGTWQLFYQEYLWCSGFKTGSKNLYLFM